jgi:ABC-type transport system substrate-binding protein
MKQSKLIALLGLLVVASMILAACQPAAGGNTANNAEENMAEENVAEENVAEEDMAEDMPAFEGASVAAASCDYGGKILSIEATGQYEVTFSMCGPVPAFREIVAFTPFGIQPEEYIASTGGTGALLEAPIGTGPYMVSAWNRGDSVVYTRFDGYWGEPAAAATAILRWNAEGAARLLELQAGTADMITNVSPGDFETVESDPNLVLIPNINPNVLYIGFTNTFAPFDNVDVRRAIAMGVDRQRIVDNFYPPLSEVASHFTPCSIPNGCAGEEWYGFDLDAANALLDAAGFPKGDDGIRFSTTISYRNVFRGYLPEPGLVAQEIQAQLLENLGIDAEVVEMESGEFIATSTNGELSGIHLLGWGADYPHVTNFLDFHFGNGNPQFGSNHPEIYENLEAAAGLSSVEEAAPFYEAANNAIRDLIPMIPVVHGASADAALASVSGAYVPPFGATDFSLLDSGKDTLVFVQNAEPISLYCADETDGESLRPCQQVVETLLAYGTDSGETHPLLATGCEANDDLTVWVCTLREGVTFHDGSSFDANDVIASWAAGIDASNPNHVGNTGGFDYYAYLWDSLMNAGE